MNNTPRRPGYNIDGIVTPRRGQLPNAKFARPVTAPKIDDRLRHIRTRRPTFHQSPAVSLPAPRQPAPLKLPPAQPTYTSARPKPPVTAAPTSHKQRLWRKFKLNARTKRVAKRSSIVVGVLVLCMAGWLGWKVLHATGKVFGSDSSLLGFLSATPLKCEGTGRCNILLAGNSADDPGHDGANLTDSIMIVSIDMKNKNALLLSVPRDLYVNIPGNGHDKINAAYPDGQASHFSQTGYAKGGMGLLEETISQNFGIPISNYALIDYSALKQAVNTVGGISITIQSNDPRGMYDPSIDWSTHGPLVKLSNGTHTLNGEQALDLARARGDAYGAYGFADSDFDRTQNQRMMMLALKSKVTSSSTLANPLKLGQLFDAFGNNVHTDLKPGNVRRLYDLFKSVPNSSIKSIGLNNVTLSGQQNVNLLKNYTTPTHQSALIPASGVDDFSQIQLYLKQLTSNDPIVREAATVVVLNGSTTTGLAAAEGQVLTSKGISVSHTANATTHQANTTIIDNSKGKDPATLAKLKQLFGVASTTSNSALTTANPSAAFIVVLGQSQQLPAASSTSP